MVVAAPLWLFADAYGWFYLFDPFGSFPLLMDDFPYLAESRTTASLRSNLFTPHNAHVVPLFRLWIHLLGRLAGTLEGLPVALGAGSFLVLAMAMATIGHFVARESGNRWLGLASMAVFGVSTVIEPAAAWFSAGQALWGGLGALGMLVLLQDWRASGGRWRLVLAALAAALAPAFWSGGYAALPAGLAYLAASGAGGKDRKLAAITLVVAVLVVAAGAWIMAARSVGGIPTDGSQIGPMARLTRGVGHTGQAIPEALVLGNLGLSAETSANQGATLSLAIAALWAWSRRGRGPIRPLEAAGATLALTSLLMAFVFRAGSNYSSLRALGWYHAIPQVGTVLFAAGWWAAMHEDDRRPGLRRRDALMILLIVIGLIVVHSPRSQSFFLGRLPAPGTWEIKAFPIPILQRDRGIYLQSERTEWLRRSLARLDRAEGVATRLGVSRGAIRRSIGRLYLPMWPAQIQVPDAPDAIDLLDIPRDGPDLDPSQRAALMEWLEPLPEPRPKYLPPGEPWPARQGRDDP